ncbi:MAG: polyphosphate kinase, partial [Cyanobacteria bacterium P01_H01_bin.153]
MTAADISLAIDLNEPQYYFNRELSWLKFNDRVLHEAIDSRTPFLERLKFTAIFSSNLDEFYMVRVSGLLDQINAGINRKTSDGLSPIQVMEAIRTHLRPKLRQQHDFFQTELRPQLQEHGVYLLDYEQMDAQQQQYLKQYFESQIFPVLTPLSVDPAHPFPRLSNLSLNLAVAVKNPDTKIQKFARIKVPNNLPRFIGLPSELIDDDAIWVGTTLENIIANHLNFLFPGMEVSGHYLFRITRDADFPVREDEADDLLVAIEEEISKRRLEGFVCRLEIEESMPDDMLEGLMRELRVAEEDIYELNGVLDLKDLFFFMSMPLSALKYQPWSGQMPPRLKSVERGEESIFSVVRKQDLLVHHPYESFSGSVQAFVASAARDPHVLTIKITLYRT